MSDWKFEITTPDGVLINYVPRGDFSIEHKRKKNNPEFEVSVPSFVLYDTDYQTVLDYERNHDYRRFDVKIFCQASLWYDGYFTIFDGKFCAETCSVEVEVKDKLKANCISDADTEYNLSRSDSINVPRYIGTYEFAATPFLNINFYFPDSMKLVDVINWYLKQNCLNSYSLTSEFLTSSTNYVTGNPNELLDVYVEEMSNASNQGAVNAATILNTSLDRILNDLQIMYDIVWWLDGLNLRIEHSSYLYDKNEAIDLTEFEIVEMADCFEYDLNKIPKSVSYKFDKNSKKLELSAEDFGEQSIEFRDASGEFYPFATGSTKKNNIKGVATDIISIVFTEDLLDDYIYVILENNGGTFLEVEESTGILSGNVQPNNKLSWSYLLENYHNHNQQYIGGWVNGNYKTFESVEAYKEQEPIVLKFDCNTFQELDFAKKLVKTNIGYGLVESYTIDTKKCQVIITPKIY